MDSLVPAVDACADVCEAGTVNSALTGLTDMVASSITGHWCSFSWHGIRGSVSRVSRVCYCHTIGSETSAASRHETLN